MAESYASNDSRIDIFSPILEISEFFLFANYEYHSSNNNINSLTCKRSDTNFKPEFQKRGMA